jgi:hypothetical protein
MQRSRSSSAAARKPLKDAPWGDASWYDAPMNQKPGQRRPAAIARAALEMAFIIFLFYSNLLMGEFTAAAGRGKSFAFALQDIFTEMNFAIACISALIGYVGFEYLRKKL